MEFSQETAEVLLRTDQGGPGKRRTPDLKSLTSSTEKTLPGDPKLTKQIGIVTSSPQHCTIGGTQLAQSAVSQSERLIKQVHQLTPHIALLL